MSSPGSSISGAKSRAGPTPARDRKGSPPGDRLRHAGRGETALSSHLLMLPEGSSSSRLRCYSVRAVLTSSQGRDAIDLLLDDLRQLERIGGGAQPEPFVHLGAVDIATGPQPVERGLRAVVDALEPGADALLAQQLHRGLEQVHHQRQLVAGEGVEQADGRGAGVAGTA